MRSAAASYDNPEERPLAERCILGFNSGPPMVPSAYNNNVQIVQTRGHVVIVNEMIHSARIVDMSGRAASALVDAFLTGDSVGRWDGDTLLVDTTNFSKEGGIPRRDDRSCTWSSGSRASTSDTLRYEFTVDDPDDLDEDVDGVHPDDPQQRADVRVRLPRGELRDGRRDEGRALPGPRSQD